MRKRVRTRREFEKELEGAVIAAEVRPLDRGYATRGAAASTLLVRWRENGEDVHQVADDWNVVLRSYRMRYWVLGLPLVSTRIRPIVIAPILDQ